MNVGKWRRAPASPADYIDGMDPGAHRIQFTTRNLMEIVFWFAAGIGSFQAAARMAAGHPKSSLEFGVGLTLFLFPGAAFGAATGVPVRKRGRMALAGFLVWLFGLCLISVVN